MYNHPFPYVAPWKIILHGATWEAPHRSAPHSAHPALTARQGSADNALSRHLWPTGQPAVDDLCGRGHEAPPPAAPISFGAEQHGTRTTKVENLGLQAILGCFEAGEQGYWSSVLDRYVLV